MNYSTVGIDQSLTGTGICLITVTGGKAHVSYKKVCPGKRRGVERLTYIVDQLCLFLAKAPNLMCGVMEGYSIDSLNRSFDLGELGGVIKLTLAAHLHLPFYVVPPTSLKKYVTGYGQASKEDMMKVYGVIDDNLADAQGLAELGRSILTNEYTTRCQLEVITAVKANPENNKTTKKRVVNLANKKKYKAQLTVI